MEAASQTPSATSPESHSEGEIIERLAAVERILHAVYSRSPSRLILRWFLRDMHALIAEARRLLGEHQRCVHLP